jgi:hypothetical protein
VILITLKEKLSRREKNLEGTFFWWALQVGTLSFCFLMYKLIYRIYWKNGQKTKWVKTEKKSSSQNKQKLTLAFPVHTYLVSLKPVFSTWVRVRP